MPPIKWDLFSVFGYAGVALLLVLPLLWAVHWWRRPRRWLCHVAVVIALAAFALAKVNSVTYVNRIEEDRSEQIERAAKAIEEDRKRREAERAEDVANVRFIEDGRDDFLDKGGMDEDDRAYYEGQGAAKEDEPAWKRQKVQREFGEDESLDNAIGAVEDKEGVDAGRVVDPAAKPIIMDVKYVRLANRLDGLVLKMARLAIWFGLGFVGVDYLRRFHCYDDSYLPLPIPDVCVRAISPAPAVSSRPETPRREMVEELQVLIRQGATFICLTDDDSLADSLPAVMYRWPRNLGQVEVLPVAFDGEYLSMDFVFESLWFGRAAFVETDRVCIDEILARFSELLVERKASRARTRQPVVIAWHRSEPVPEVFEENMRILGPVTGVSLFVCGQKEG